MKVLKPILYWALQLTWGIIPNVLGIIVFIVSTLFLKGTPHKNGYGVIVEIGGNWGGVSLGAFALCGRYSLQYGPCYNLNWYEHTRKHEFGHSLQNILFGPLYLILVSLPSTIRYWLIRCKLTKTEYDSVWFEGTATKWGTKAIECIEKNRV